MSAMIEPAISGAGMTLDDREAEACALLVARGRLKDSDLGRAPKGLAGGDGMQGREAQGGGADLGFDGL